MSRDLLIKVTVGFAIICVMLVSSNLTWADWSPWDISIKTTTSIKKAKETNVFRLFFKDAIHLFQTRISPIDGPRCNFYPTCSEYGRQCIARYGVSMGIAMTADRLLRCNYCAAKHYPIENGKLIDLP